MATFIPLIDRIDYQTETGCWNWKGAKNQYGYGITWFMGKLVSANRLAAHLWLRFDLKSKLRVLHKCDNPACFNPKHLFVGTQLDNMRDMAVKGRSSNGKKTHCPQGHPYSGENLVTYGNNRQCKACIARRNQNRGSI